MGISHPSGKYRPDLHGHKCGLRPGGNHTLTGHWEPIGNAAAQAMTAHLHELRPGGNHTLTGHWEPSGNVAALDIHLTATM